MPKVTKKVMDEFFEKWLNVCKKGDSPRTPQDEVDFMQNRDRLFREMHNTLGEEKANQVVDLVWKIVSAEFDAATPQSKSKKIKDAPQRTPDKFPAVPESAKVDAEDEPGEQTDGEDSEHQQEETDTEPEYHEEKIDDEEIGTAIP